MAPSGPRDEEDVDAPQEATDDGTAEEELDDFDVDDEDLPFDGATGYDDGDDAFVGADPLPDQADDEDDPEDGDADDDVAPLLAADEELAEVVAAVDDEPDEDDAVREGEFICRSCFMAKRDSALADEDAMLCRDCV